MNRARILNLGAGVQSTVLYLMSITGEVPAYDYAIFADTQEEPDAVYDHLEWLERLNGPPILKATAGKLGDHLAMGVNGRGGRFASIPAYTLAEYVALSESGMTRRQCTADYKIKVVERVIRRDLLGVARGARVPRGIAVSQAYGITIDEAGRAQRIKVNWRHKWTSPEFPLLTKFMGRKDCIEWLKQFGVPHEVPRSACVFCPYKSNHEWRRLRDEDSAGWARALYIDEMLRKPGNVVNRMLNQKLYLHRSCVPLSEADIDGNANGRQMSLGFAIQCTGGCGL